MTPVVTLRNDCLGGQIYVFHTMNSIRMSFYRVPLRSDITISLSDDAEESFPSPPSFTVFAYLQP